VVIGIDVEKLQKTLGDSPDIAIPHGEQPEPCQHHDYAFDEFNGGNRSHAFDVFGIVNLRMHAGVS